MSLDFKGLNASLTANAWNILPEWLPGGTRRGKEYVCGSIQGGEGSSFSVNLDSGVWKEFGNGDQVGGSDLISLWAAIQGLPQGEAFKQLSEKYDGVRPQPKREVARLPEPMVAPPPSDSTPDVGDATATWVYRDQHGKPVYYVARYDKPANGKPASKIFRPFSWDGTTWVSKSPPAPRPLYGLELLAARPGAPILVVEGEGKCEVARRLFGSVYVCIAWPNGANSVNKADWSPAYGRKALLWPDNNEVGVKAMNDVATILAKHSPEIKIVDVSDLPEGHDLGDCSTWSSAQAFEWARPRASIWKPPVEVVVDDPDPLKDWSQLVSANKDGAIICNADNVLLMLEGCPKFREKIWFDEFFNRAYTTIESEAPRPWKDSYETHILCALQRKYGVPHLSRTMVRDAMDRYLLLNRRNSVRDWMLTLKWDGASRVKTFFRDMYGSLQPGEYTTAVSKNFWVSMVARVMQPGCKSDHMVILEGKQGAYKSTSLSVIGGEWFAEIHEDMGNKDFALSLQGKLIVEIAELESFRRAKDVTVIKKTLSCQVDRVRAPYGRTHEDLPRQCILVGTTNEEEYLHDTTGNRRYWPIRCGNINLEAIALNREQLFAEAVHLYQAGADWHEVPPLTTEREQVERTSTHPWQDKIDAWLDLRGHNTDYHTRPDRIAADCLKIEDKDLSPHDIRIIRDCLLRLGWTSGHVAWEGAKSIKVWKKTPPEPGVK